MAWIEYIFCCYTASLYLSTRLGSLKCMRPERIMYETRPQHPYATQSSHVDVRENLLETPVRSRRSLYKRLLGLPIFGTPRPYVTINLERLGAMCGRERLSSDVSEIKTGVLDPAAPANSKLCAELGCRAH